MKKIPPLVMLIIALVLAVLGAKAISAQGKQDKYTLKVQNGLAFSEFKAIRASILGPISTAS